MNNGPPSLRSESSNKQSGEVQDSVSLIQQLHKLLSSSMATALVWSCFLLLITTSASAQSDVGNVYCGTGVETGISIVFGAIAGLGLPATGFYVTSAGLSYMRAGGNPEKKNKAKEKLVMSGIGFAIIVLALISPELIDNVGSQMGFNFSECVKPF